jgi:hypothetical protein
MKTGKRNYPHHANNPNSRNNNKKKRFGVQQKQQATNPRKIGRGQQGRNHHLAGKDNYNHQKRDEFCKICKKTHEGKWCYKQAGACLRCGLVGHYIKDCPNTQSPTPRVEFEKGKAVAQGRVYAITTNEPRVVAGTTTTSYNP